MKDNKIMVRDLIIAGVMSHKYERRLQETLNIRFFTIHDQIWAASRIGNYAGTIFRLREKIYNVLNRNQHGKH